MYIYICINPLGALNLSKLFEPAKATGSMISPLCGWMYGCADGCMCGCNELISEMAPTIFLKLGMKLGDNKGKKARHDFL